MSVKWYVLYGHKRLMKAPSESGALTLQHCDTEDEAKQFACKLLKQGIPVDSLGTLVGEEKFLKLNAAAIADWCHGNSAS